jgi:hypothetical protein
MMSRENWIWFGIAWALLAVGIASALSPLNIPRIGDISRHGASVTGVVTGTDCGNHNTVDYSFKFGGRTYAGSEQGGPCGSVKPGDVIKVYFSAVSPENNETMEPVGDLWNETISITLASLTSSLFIILGFKKWWNRWWNPKTHNV